MDWDTVHESIAKKKPLVGLLVSYALASLFTLIIYVVPEQEIIFFDIISFSLCIIPMSINNVFFGYIFSYLISSGKYRHGCLSLGFKCSPKEIGSSPIVDYSKETFSNYRTFHHLDEFGDLSNIIQEQNIERIYIRTKVDYIPQIKRVLMSIKNLSVDVIIVPIIDDDIDLMRASPVIYKASHITLFHKPIQERLQWCKRKFDILVSTAALLLAAPLLVCIALAIKFDSKGPIIFRQNRIGFNGVIFSAYKFRTMYHDKRDINSTKQTMKNDPRVTRIGKHLRRFSLDELPQLLNVLEGTMSIVGPRPHALNTSAQGKYLDEVVSAYAFRHRIKPGITGWAQVNGYRGEIDSTYKIKKRVDHDLYYINHWSLKFDIMIIMRTIPLMLGDINAY